MEKTLTHLKLGVKLKGFESIEEKAQKKAVRQAAEIAKIMKAKGITWDMIVSGANVKKNTLNSVLKANKAYTNESYNRIKIFCDEFCKKNQKIPRDGLISEWLFSGSASDTKDKLDN